MRMIKSRFPNAIQAKTKIFFSSGISCSAQKLQLLFTHFRVFLREGDTIKKKSLSLHVFEMKHASLVRFCTSLNEVERERVYFLR